MENELASAFAALQQTFSLLCQEVAQLEGRNLKDLWSEVVLRTEQDPTARVLWLLIATLAVSGLIFVLSVCLILFEAAVRLRKKSGPSSNSSQKLRSNSKSADDADKKLAEAIEWAEKMAPRSAIESLRAGDIQAAEKALNAQRRKQPDNVGLIMYLLACRAMRNDAQTYDSLIDEIFPKELSADDAVSRHAAEIGRLLDSARYPESKFPPPEKVFEVDAEMIGDTLGQIAELGSVKTLLDLVRMEFEMGETDQIRHLLVEILVCGTASERKLALNYANRIGRKGES